MRPTKKKLLPINEHNIGQENFKDGYNVACDDWEIYLPDTEELESILFHNLSAVSYAAFGKAIARIIAERIGKKK